MPAGVKGEKEGRVVGPLTGDTAYWGQVPKQVPPIAPPHLPPTVLREAKGAKTLVYLDGPITCPRCKRPAKRIERRVVKNASGENAYYYAVHRVKVYMGEQYLGERTVRCYLGAENHYHPTPWLTKAMEQYAEQEASNYVKRFAALADLITAAAAKLSEAERALALNKAKQVETALARGGKAGPA
jgi:hypothetical protein